MDIGIIGAGRIGGSLTRRLAGLGHAVRVSNSRAPDTLADLADETGATAVWAREAATDADLVEPGIGSSGLRSLRAVCNGCNLHPALARAGGRGPNVCRVSGRAPVPACLIRAPVGQSPRCDVS
jgi:hypothetical protein